ncbi:protein of unknown function with TonB domain [Nitrospira sp. KM1]|uniref:energy transducer TonB n=1 Tax=Nitrospira sp. KM1 TaxID=1936990 RepID=UPI0013A787DA|nr:TonB family protein [Nitrospira sp. KM1]BCA55760.1 protein of unknown function with TonB domain [Nitrospira sp. KM1]
MRGVESVNFSNTATAVDAKQMSGQLRLRGWGLSIGLHGFAVAGSMLLMAQIQPPPLKETFQWDVSVVEAPTEKPVMAAAQPMRAPVPPTPPRPQKATPAAEPPPPVVTRSVQSKEQPVVMQRDQPRTIEQVTPVVQAQPVEQHQEPVQENIQPQQVQMAERQVEQATHEAVRHEEPVQEAPPYEKVIAPAQPVPTQTTVAAVQHEMAPAAIEQQRHDAPVQRAAPAQESSPPVSERADSVAAAPPAPMVTETPVQVAKATVSGPETKADHRWIAESLGRRLAELKRYPSSARMNGLEGKVILKAVIRSDGQLAEVSVQKSSGHAVLDAAAIEAVRLACPLHMKHAIERPQVVVSVPMVYSLAN